jgi:two-component system chemotaxis response regulator CheB
MVAIGASTGGPAVLRTVLSGLGSDFPAPVLVAQHMAEGFIEGFVRWLDTQTDAGVRIAQAGERPQPAVAYFPPSGHHLTVARHGALDVVPCDGQGPCPSVNRLFRSVADHSGPRALCLLLTGMGSDGAEGLLQAEQSNALTAVQDEETSVVFGMPREALRLGATSCVLSEGEMIPWLVRHVGAGRR